MKSPLIVTLSIIGVLGMAGAAMAVNSDALGAIDQGTIGLAAEVLAPVSTGGVAPAPEVTPDPTSTAGDVNVTPSPSPSQSSTGHDGDSSGSKHDDDHNDHLSSHDDNDD